MTQPTAVTKVESTMAQRFTAKVIKEFSALSGGLELTPLQKRLAQHLFIKIDVALKLLETKRLDANREGLPITWQNINLPKLAIDAVHRIDLGLDALIPNHLHPIPYWNSREKKYDLDLRVGYVGKDYYRRQMALEEPIAIVYELVYSTDKFQPIKRNQANEVETYEFEIPQPFDRGEIIGGFGYLVYEDHRKNTLVIVTEKDFTKSQARAKTNQFWSENPVEMRYKTLVHRVTDKLSIDPAKTNVSFAAVEADEARAFEQQIAGEIDEKANRTLIDVHLEAEAGADVAGEPKQLTEPEGAAAEEVPLHDPGF